jgi:hypothetical protein
VPFHGHAAAMKYHPFGLQAKPLLHGGIPTQFDLPSRAQYAMPWQFKRSSQHAYHLPRSAWVSRSTRYAAVRGNLAARNFPNRGNNAGLHCHQNRILFHPLDRNVPAAGVQHHLERPAMAFAEDFFLCRELRRPSGKQSRR